MQAQLEVLFAATLSACFARWSPAPAAELPVLGPPRQLLAGGAPITAVTGHAAPFVLDYDGDGVRDLVVGMFGNDGNDGNGKEVVSGGTGRFYRNVGTNAEPKYEAFVSLMAKGRPISMESG
jgi:hypothetical protein